MKDDTCNNRPDSTLYLGQYLVLRLSLGRTLSLFKGMKIPGLSFFHLKSVHLSTDPPRLLS